MPHKSGGAAGKLRFDAQIEFGAYPDGTVQLAAGDFDNDGADDVVVGSSAGTFIHRGASTGPTLQTEVGTGYAGALTVADFDRDGHDDLVVGSDFVDIGQTAKGGYATVFYGGATGVDTTRNAVFSQDTRGMPGADEPYDSFGGALAVGDVNGDRYPDLAFGAHFETVGAATHAGNVCVLPGGASGLTGTGASRSTRAPRVSRAPTSRRTCSATPSTSPTTTRTAAPICRWVRAVRTATTAPYASCAAPPEASRPPAR
ncbi:hypothetical protein ABID95_001177 [Streptomyces atratus]